MVSKTAPSPLVATQDREQHHVENSMKQVSGSVTFDTNNSTPIFAQQQKQTDSLVHQIEELDRALKNFDLPINEEQLDNPSAVNTELNSPQKFSNPMLSPSETLPTDSFLSKIAEVGEGISTLKVMSTTINDLLNSKISLNVQPNHAIKGQSEHVINGGTKEMARVCKGQGSNAHATPCANTLEKQNTQCSRQQGTWKRLNNTGVSRSNDSTTSTVESGLSTKRVHEGHSYLNGLLSKKREVSIEINSTAMAEADD